jgi:carboxyl-terminal processing protease
MSRRFGLVAISIIITATLVGGTFGRHKKPLLAARETTPAKGVTAGKVEDDFREALDTVSANYAGEVDYEKANQAAIQGMLWTLDPHSTFFPRDEFKKMREDQDSRIYGIGVNILRHRDGVYVQSAVENTPAARAGLRYGDRIVEVNGLDARDWSTDQVSKRVRGDRGETVTLKVERAGALAPLYFTIMRDAVPVPSIRAAFMVRPGTGYIGLTGSFQHTTGDELRKAISDLQEQGLKQLVLDLRNNPGGLLDQAIAVASQFLPRGQVIVSIRGREYNEPIVHKSTGADYKDFPLVVLVNRNSASASEIVAGAIQDHDRGLIVGETSFGKGLVQRVFLLPLGTGLHLTMAKYYTPSGRLIQRDYSNGSLHDYYARHELDDQKSATAPAPSDPTKSGQVPPRPQPAPTPNGPAYKSSAGRVFYGGGGITPDIIVKPMDFSSPGRRRISEAAFFFVRELAAGLVPGLESYRVAAPQYGRTPHPTDYPVNDRVIEAFRSFVKRDGTFGLSGAHIDADLDFVKMRIRAEILTAAFGSEAGNRVTLESDPQLLRAIEALPDAKRLAESVYQGKPVG